MSFECGGFEIHGGERADSAGERESLKRRPWRREGGGVNRERENERVGAGGWRGGARLQCGVRGWPGTSSTVGTWRRSTNLGLGVVETEPSQTIRCPKRTIREAECYSTGVWRGRGGACRARVRRLFPAAAPARAALCCCSSHFLPPYDPTHATRILFDKGSCGLRSAVCLHLRDCNRELCIRALILLA